MGFKSTEKTTTKYTSTIQDEDGTALEPGDLTSLTLTLFDRSSGGIINSRNAQDIKNTNGGTVAAGGAFTMVFDPADMVIVDSERSRERHTAIFEWTYNGGVKGGKHRVDFLVENLDKVS